MATQTYQVGVPFNTYTSAEVVEAGGVNDWTWEGRTLCGYISADNYANVIPPGGELTLNSNTGSLKGYWELNKLDLSIYILGGGEDTYVEVSCITHENENNDYYLNCMPLTIDEVSYEVNNHAKNGDVCKFWFNSRLKCVIHPGTNRTLSSVWFDSNRQYIGGSLSPENHGAISSFSFPPKMAGGGNICINEVLSIYLVEGGIMTYAGNKNTVNPNHPTLDD